MLFTNYAYLLSTEFRDLVIFDQWPNLNLGFDVEPEIRILKVIYIHTASLKCKFRNLFLFRRNKAPLLKYMYAQNIFSIHALVTQLKNIALTYLLILTYINAYHAISSTLSQVHNTHWGKSTFKFLTSFFVILFHPAVLNKQVEVIR